ncbi:Rrf2 family transcriptional regulator [Kineosporia sp. J2-2]|uniref:Rrf2 family transcriptional regulator n=1 Tax=Kineosporia corallincola TaxID=2835133 RepID=A0ABS5TR59_9ACTN|nr:Rrf2 family transcriptional regulator [Kineosporia corallincola]MBT0773128.1 Rrf2 family transcriptional regulator [Kineosporia corallincola]
MKMSDGVEWAVHCCVVLTAADRPVPAARLAEFHDVSGSYLAKQLQALSRAQIIRSVQGKDGGYVLARPPEQISVYDIVRAVDGGRPAFVCTEIRQRGPMGSPAEKCLAPCGIARTMAVAEQAWRDSLRGVTVSDLATEVAGKRGTGGAQRLGAWLNGEPL